MFVFYGNLNDAMMSPGEYVVFKSRIIWSLNSSMVLWSPLILWSCLRISDVILFFAHGCHPDANTPTCNQLASQGTSGWASLFSEDLSLKRIQGAWNKTQKNTKEPWLGLFLNIVQKRRRQRLCMHVCVPVFVNHKLLETMLFYFGSFLIEHTCDPFTSINRLPSSEPLPSSS